MFNRIVRVGLLVSMILTLCVLSNSSPKASGYNQNVITLSKQYTAQSICTDSDDNLIIASWRKFDDNFINKISTLSSDDLKEHFSKHPQVVMIEKRDKNQNRIWSKELKLNTIPSLTTKIDASSNVYLYFTDRETTDSCNYLLKLNANGELQWFKKFILQVAKDELFDSKMEDITIDDNLNIFALFKTDKLILAKFKPTGEMEWSKQCDGSDITGSGYKIRINNDNKIVVTGFKTADDNMYSSSRYDNLFLTFDLLGNLISSFVYRNDLWPKIDMDIVFDQDDNMYIASVNLCDIFSNKSIDGTELVFLKYTKLGNLLYKKRVKARFSPSTIHLYLTKSNELYFTGSSTYNMYELIKEIPKNLSNNPYESLEELNKYMYSYIGKVNKIGKCEWIKTFQAQSLVDTPFTSNTHNDECKVTFFSNNKISTKYDVEFDIINVTGNIYKPSIDVIDSNITIEDFKTDFTTSSTTNDGETKKIYLSQIILSQIEKEKYPNFEYKTSFENNPPQTSYEPEVVDVKPPKGFDKFSIPNRFDYHKIKTEKIIFTPDNNATDGRMSNLDILPPDLLKSRENLSFVPFKDLTHNEQIFLYGLLNNSLQLNGSFRELYTLPNYYYYLDEYLRYLTLKNEPMKTIWSSSFLKKALKNENLLQDLADSLDDKNVNISSSDFNFALRLTSPITRKILDFNNSTYTQGQLYITPLKTATPAMEKELANFAKEAKTDRAVLNKDVFCIYYRIYGSKPNTVLHEGIRYQFSSTFTYPYNPYPYDVLDYKDKRSQRSLYIVQTNDLFLFYAETIRSLYRERLELLYKGKKASDYVIPPYFLIENPPDEDVIARECSPRLNIIQGYASDTLREYFTRYNQFPESYQSFVDHNLLPFKLSKQDVEILDKRQKQIGWQGAIPFYSFHFQRRYDKSFAYNSENHIILPINIPWTIEPYIEQSGRSFEPTLEGLIKFIDDEFGLNYPWWIEHGFMNEKHEINHKGIELVVAKDNKDMWDKSFVHEPGVYRIVAVPGTEEDVKKIIDQEEESHYKDLPKQKRDKPVTIKKGQVVNLLEMKD